MYSVVNRVLKIYSPLSSSEKAASTSLINHPLIKKRLLQCHLQHYLRPARVCGRFNLASSKTQTDSPRREHSLQVNPWPGTAALGPSPTTPATARAMPWRTSHVLAVWPSARPLLPRRYFHMSRIILALTLACSASAFMVPGKAPRKLATGVRQQGQSAPLGSAPASLAPAPPQSAPGGSGQLALPRRGRPTGRPSTAPGA